MDNYVEYLIKKENTRKDVIIMNLVVVLGIALVVVSIIFGRSFGIILAVALGYGAYVLLNSFNLEYEYIVTGSSIDIDKVINKSKRKKVVSFECQNVEIMARVNDENHNGVMKAENIQKKIVTVGNSKSERLYFAVFSYDNKKVLLVFEPNDMILDAIQPYMQRKLFR